MMLVNFEHGNGLTARKRVRRMLEMSSTTWKTLLARLSDRTNKDWQDHWRTFVEIYRPLLVRYVRSIAKTYGHIAEEAEVEEVVQDIFIRLSMVMSPTEMTNGHADAPSSRQNPFALDHSRGRFRSWLYTVTKNQVLDRLRKGKRRFQPLPEADYLAQVDQTPEEWDRDFQRRVFDYAIAQVRPNVAARSWHCFEQYFVKNRKAVDIAKDDEVAGLTSNAICVNALRVLEKVRAKCTEYMGETEDA